LEKVGIFFFKLDFKAFQMNYDGQILASGNFGVTIKISNFMDILTLKICLTFCRNEFLLLKFIDLI